MTRKALPPVPEVGSAVLVTNPDSTFVGRVGQVERLFERTAFVRFVGFTFDLPFGASEVADVRTLAPGELMEMFGR